MKTNSQHHLSIVLLLAGFLVLAGGCASVGKKTGVERAEKTITSMQTVDYDMKQASMQIDITKATLDSVVRTGQQPGAQAEDVKTAYTSFSDNADKMDEIGKKLNSDIDSMSSEGNAYFQEWAKEGGTYTNPQIQKQSEDRRAQLSGSFRDMELSVAGVRANLNSYLAQLDQIKKYLSNDLTPKGVAGIKPSAGKLERDGEKLKKSFVPVETAIRQARADLTPGSAAMGGAAGAAAGGAQPASENKTSTKTEKETSK